MGVNTLVSSTSSGWFRYPVLAEINMSSTIETTKKWSHLWWLLLKRKRHKIRLIKMLYHWLCFPNFAPARPTIDWTNVESFSKASMYGIWLVRFDNDKNHSGQLHLDLLLIGMYQAQLIGLDFVWARLLMWRMSIRIEKIIRITATGVSRYLLQQHTTSDDTFWSNLSEPPSSW